MLRAQYKAFAVSIAYGKLQLMSQHRSCSRILYSSAGVCPSGFAKKVSNGL